MGAVFPNLFLFIRLFFFPFGFTELLEIPETEIPYTSVYEYTGFTLKYNEDLKISDWVAYELTGEEVTTLNAPRSNRFYSDKTIPEKTAEDSDYKYSGYDRGHLAPAADMRFSKDAMKACFCLTNIAPQTPEFNRGIWAELEQEIRKWAIRDGSLLIVTGPAFVSENFNRIGKNSVAVPEFFYKVILDYSLPEKKGIAFIIPNKKTDNPFYSYAVSIDEAEELTGLNFFPWLPENELFLESEIDASLWQK